MRRGGVYRPGTALTERPERVVETDPGSDGKRRETAVSARPFSARLFRLFFTLTIFIGECGGKGASREPSRDPPPTPALLRWGRGRPWRLCRLLSAELKPNYPQLINLEPIRIFPTTCTCSQEPGRGRRDGAHSGHSGEGEGAAGWVRRTPRPAQEARQRSPGPWCLAAVLLPGGGPP